MEIKKLIPAPEIRNWTGPFDDKEYYFNLGKEQSEKIIQWLSIKLDQKILDIGCGCQVSYLSLKIKNEVLRSNFISIHYINYNELF